MGIGSHPERVRIGLGELDDLKATCTMAMVVEVAFAVAGMLPLLLNLLLRLLLLMPTAGARSL
jgi:hypothetical protein